MGVKERAEISVELGEALMRMLLGIILGAFLTVSAAFIPMVLS